MDMKSVTHNAIRNIWGKGELWKISLFLLLGIFLFSTTAGAENPVKLTTQGRKGISASVSAAKVKANPTSSRSTITTSTTSPAKAKAINLPSGVNAARVALPTAVAKPASTGGIPLPKAGAPLGTNAPRVALPTAIAKPTGTGGIPLPNVPKAGLSIPTLGANRNLTGVMPQAKTPIPARVLAGAPLRTNAPRVALPAANRSLAAVRTTPRLAGTPVKSLLSAPKVGLPTPVLSVKSAPKVNVRALSAKVNPAQTGQLQAQNTAVPKPVVSLPKGLKAQGISFYKPKLSGVAAKPVLPSNRKAQPQPVPRSPIEQNPTTPKPVSNNNTSSSGGKSSSAPISAIPLISGIFGYLPRKAKERMTRSISEIARRLENGIGSVFSARSPGISPVNECILAFVHRREKEEKVNLNPGNQKVLNLGFCVFDRSLQAGNGLFYGLRKDGR